MTPLSDNCGTGAKFHLGGAKGAFASVEVERDVRAR
jgi:hypothetical protein